MIPQLGFQEIVVLGGVAVLLFGSRLPEVGRSLGRSLVEFKKGLQGLSDELDLTTPLRNTSSASTQGDGLTRSSATSRPMSSSVEANVPKFEPPVQPARTPSAESTPTETHD